MTQDPTTTDPRAVVLWLIAEDMYNDARTADGKPFTGKTVGEQFGYLYAAVMALASVTASILREQTHARVESSGQRATGAGGMR